MKYRLSLANNYLSTELLTKSKEIKDQQHLEKEIQSALTRALWREATEKTPEQKLLDKWARSLTDAGMQTDEGMSLDGIVENLKANGVMNLLSAGTKFPMKLEEAETDDEEETWESLTMGLTQAQPDWM